jgi:ketosteroid isomerase-like protein
MGSVCAQSQTTQPAQAHPHKTAAQPAQVDANGKAEREILAALKELDEAGARGDNAVRERFYLDDALFIDVWGNLNNRVRPTPSANAHHHHDPPARDEIRVQVYGDAAWVSSRLTFKEGTKVTQTRTSGLWVKREGRWQLAAWQVNRLLPERAAIKVDPKIYDAYAGQYQRDSDAVLVITREGDSLMMQVGGTTLPKQALLPESATSFFNKDKRLPTTFTFVKDERGQVTHLIVRAEEQESKLKKIK